ncbi:MAG: beta-ketoacyl-ACP synthase III, partial [Alphaproteobacteria bacterium]|nr:beta-ketoacyl-ACP synthase III [Alphaproteobacteria bacterium]
VAGYDVKPGFAPDILHEYGNTSSAGAIIAFHKYSADLVPGDHGQFCAFGAGYSAGSAILRKMAV